MNLRRSVQKMVLASLAGTGLASLVQPVLGGRGVILMLHRTRPKQNLRDQEQSFQPNAHLEITPEFLEELLQLMPELGYDWVRLEDVPEKLKQGPSARRFAAVTLDDGYKDNIDFAVPLFQKHNVPYTIFVVPGFVNATALPWWITLEEVLKSCDHIVCPTTIEVCSGLSTATLAQKQEAYLKFQTYFLEMDQDKVQLALTELCEANGLKAESLMSEAFLTWQQVETLSGDPLCTIGGHTQNHPNLARVPQNEIAAEIEAGLKGLEEHTQERAPVFAYPFGFPAAAAEREFKQLDKMDFACSVTTRPGVLYPSHLDHLSALPRLSVNGLFQEKRYIKALLSGLPFFLANKASKMNIT